MITSQFAAVAVCIGKPGQLRASWVLIDIGSACAQPGIAGIRISATEKQYSTAIYSRGKGNRGRVSSLAGRAAFDRAGARIFPLAYGFVGFPYSFHVYLIK